VPNTLVALCLNAGGLERVRSVGALSALVPIFTQRQYLRALASDTPSAIGAGLDELLRHVPTLRREGVNTVFAIFRRLCIIGGEQAAQSTVLFCCIDRSRLPPLVLQPRRIPALGPPRRVPPKCCNRRWHGSAQPPGACRCSAWQPASFLDHQAPDVMRRCVARQP
jgi:Domain of Unknown Function (DUF913)